MPATRYDLRIEQGKTVQKVVRWETLPLKYHAITNIAQAAPALITVPNHQIPDGWRVAIIDVVGMDEINARNSPPRANDFHRATVESVDSISLNDISTASFDPYISGGSVVYYTPVPLAGYTARMKIKDRVGGTVLATLVSPTDITVETDNYTITVVISATASELFTWTKGVYDLEMVSDTGVVTAILAGTVTIIKEVTTA